MKYLWVICFLISGVSLAQLSDKDQHYVDSLLNITTGDFHDTTKVDAFDLLAIKYRKLKDYKQATTYFQQSLQLNEKLNDSVAFAYSHYDLGVTYYRMRDYDEAYDEFLACLQISEIIPFQRGIAISLNSLGLISKRKGNLDEALQYYLRSYEVRNAMGDKKSLGTPLNNIGNIYDEKGDYANAFVYYKKAIEIEEELKDIRGLSITTTYFGNSYKDQGNYPKAIHYFQQSLGYYRQRGDSSKLKYPLNGLGLVYRRMGENDKAIRYYQRALEINEEIEDPEGIAASCNNLGLAYNKTDPNKAIDFYNRGLKISQEINDVPTIAALQINLSTSYYAKGDYQKALDYGRKSIENARKSESYNYITDALATTFYASFTLEKLDESKNLILELMQLRNKEIQINLPLLAEKEKELYFEIIRSDYELFYDYALSQKHKMPEITDQVYDNVLVTKGLLLKSSTAMRNAVLSSKDSTLMDSYHEWIELKKKMAENFGIENIEELEDRANELEKGLVRAFNEFSGLRIEDHGWKDVQAGLEKGEAAIEFVRFLHQENFWVDSLKHEVYCALIIQKDYEHPKMIELFDASELEEVLGKYPGTSATYIEQNYGSKKQKKSELYNLIWKPMEKNLKGVSKIYISPDGLLHKVSFAALAKNQKVYLSDLYEIKNITSSSLIANAKKHQLSPDTEVSLFGDIVYNTDSSSKEIWNYLEGTRKESEEIVQILENAHKKVNYYHLNQATEEQFKSVASQSDILHIATHGFFYPEVDHYLDEYVDREESSLDLVFRGGRQGYGSIKFVENRNHLMRSGLVFAGANDVWSQELPKGSNDGVLTAAEVATIDMRKTDLVVLSACETGLGDIKGSEGVYGLQRSFKMAGVRYIIMSLWQVPDKETAEFMTIFYQNLTQFNDIEVAFSETQKLMRKKYDPYYWAAFVLIQ